VGGGEKGKNDPINRDPKRLRWSINSLKLGGEVKLLLEPIPRRSWGGKKSQKRGPEKVKTGRSVFTHISDKKQETKKNRKKGTGQITQRILSEATG